MKKSIYSAFLAFISIFTISCEKELVVNNNNELTETHEHVKGEKCCLSHDCYMKMAALHPEIAEETKRLESFAKNRSSARSSEQTTEEITIPVIVHVVYNTPEQNIKWSQVRSQIDALNRDFNAENDDLADVPNVYRKRIADVGIKFELKRITRTKTDVVEFIEDFNTEEIEIYDIMRPEKGGKRISDPKKYLNIYVGNIQLGVNGIGTFPAMGKVMPEIDGVIIDYENFGTNGTADSFRAQGRIAVHEIGHWLNLRHLSGDDGRSCRPDDGVSDTPKQKFEYAGVPLPFPEDKSCNTPDMTMNFMQTVGDEFLLMFTNGQKDRMLATFEPGGGRETFK